jgi:hypothetical protein
MWERSENNGRRVGGYQFNIVSDWCYSPNFIYNDASNFIRYVKLLIFKLLINYSNLYCTNFKTKALICEIATTIA